MTPQEIYHSKLTTVQGALDLIQPDDKVVGGCYANEPVMMFRSLHTIAPRVRDMKVFVGNVKSDYPFMTDSTLQPHFHTYTCFFGATARKVHPLGMVSYLPYNLCSFGPDLVEKENPSVYMGAVGPMDENGYLYLSPSLQYEYESIRAARTRIVEVNPRVPRVFGATRIHISEITCVVETDCEIYELEDAKVGPVERQIAGYVTELIRDGDTLQFGIGKTSNAVAEALETKHDLGIHTEMFSSSIANLMKKGAVNNSKKLLHTGKSVCAFALGDQKLYDYLDGNPQIEMLPVAYVNTPHVIGRNDNMVSINTALQIDMTGQVCSESIGFRQFSGTGGATDFAMGAYMSSGGRGIIAVTSTAQNGKVSRIQPALSLGAAVSISRNLTDYIVTEYGVARMRGESIRSRAQQLIAISHPDFREELRRQAKDLMIW